MNYVKVCPTCKESIATTPLVEIVVTYREDLSQAEIYEQGWHKKCYPSAPAMLAALTEGIGIPDSADFASDLEIIAHFLKVYHPISSNDLRAKAQAIRAAIAAARGEA